MRAFAAVLVIGTCLGLAPAGGQAPAGAGGEVPVRLATPLGNIDLAVDVAHAPITAKNFLRYVDAGWYDGAGFYRVTRPDNYAALPPNRPMMNIIQGGRQGNDRTRFDPIPLERTSVTGLHHVAGTLSMARLTPDSATTEFFILLDDQPSLDFGGKRFDDAQGAAAFGHVVAGLDVVRAIQQQGPLRDDNKQYLVTPVPILSAKRQ
jgi:peptidyl-prolyl cis-trans isomerase A (cyclophilin A)